MSRKVCSGSTTSIRIGPTSWRHPIVAKRVRGTDHELPRAGPQRHVSVDDAEVWIHPQPGDQLPCSVALVAVQDAPVVHVAVTRGEVRHRHRRLVNRVFIEGDDHGRAAYAGGLRMARREPAQTLLKSSGHAAMDDQSDGPLADGKTAIVTGANSGLGYQTSRQLARRTALT